MSHPFGFSDALFEAANRESRRAAAALRRLPSNNSTPAIFGKVGASREKLEEIENHLGHSLPPDLIYLAEHTNDPDGLCMRWLQGPHAIEAFEERVKYGLSFDIGQNGLWLASWGPRPAAPMDRLALFEAEFQRWPKLLPLSGHRAIPATPTEAGNPVFSVMQSDIVYYGTTLADWMALDLTVEWRGDHATRSPAGRARHIPVWSDFAEGTEGFAVRHTDPGREERAKRLEEYRKRFYYIHDD